MKVERVICDICRKETEDSQQYELPKFLAYSFYGGKGNKPLIEVVDNRCKKFTADLCPDCAYELAYKIFTMQNKKVEIKITGKGSVPDEF